VCSIIAEVGPVVYARVDIRWQTHGVTTLILLLKVVHVLAATLAVGTNATAIFWLRHAGRDTVRLRFAIGGIRRVDKTIAIPAFALLVLTGGLMVWFGIYDLTEGWVLIALVLYVGLAIAGMTVMGPALKGVIAEAERDPNSAAFDAAAQTSLRYTIGSLAILVVIVVLMVTKPI
jgi:uncharacterized membrane protein